MLKPRKSVDELWVQDSLKFITELLLKGKTAEFHLYRGGKGSEIKIRLDESWDLQWPEIK